MLSVLNRREFLAVTYLLQFYEWEVSYINLPMSVNAETPMNVQETSQAAAASQEAPPSIEMSEVPL